MGPELESSNAPATTFRKRKVLVLAWAFAVLVWAAVVFVVALHLTVRTIDLSRFKASIASAVNKETGRKLTLGQGPVIALSLPPVVRFADVALSNAVWGSRKEMVHARRLEVRVRLLPLLRGRVVVDRLVAQGSNVLLETNGRGDGNWNLGPAASASPGQAGSGEAALAVDLAIHELRVTDVALTYRDGRTGAVTHLSVPHLAVTSSRSGYGRLAVDGHFVVHDTPVTVSGEIGGSASIAGNEPFPVELTASNGSVTATIHGAVRDLPQLAGVELKIAAHGNDAAALAPFLGTAPPAAVAFHGEALVKDSGRTYVADPVQVEVGKSSVSGSVTYAAGTPRPRFTADLHTPLLDLDQLLASRWRARNAPREAPAKNAKLFPSTRLPLARLGALDAAFNMRADTIVLPGGGEVHALAARAQLANGRLSVDPLSLQLGGGQITGGFHLDVRRNNSFTGRLTGGNVEVAALLATFGIKAPVSGGRSQLDLRLQGRGASMHEWMSALSGSLRVVVAQARIESRALDLGSDVVSQAIAAVSPAKTHDRATEVRCAVVNVPVERGVVRLDRRVAAETSEINLVARGTVDLGAETLDVGFRSKATRGLGLGLANFAGVARIRGSLANPTLALDAEGTAAAASKVDSAVRTRGRSLVQERVLGMLFPESPCQDALAEKQSRSFSPLELLRRR